MVSTSRAAQHYFQTQVRSSTPLELVVMLYDAALRSVTAAGDAAARHDIRARSQAVSRTLAIVGELQSSLNMEQGGAIAAELDRLYAWMTSRLVDATLQQDAAAIGEVRRVLEILHDSWSQIATSAPAAAAAAP